MRGSQLFALRKFFSADRWRSLCPACVRRPSGPRSNGSSTLVLALPGLEPVRADFDQQRRRIQEGGEVHKSSSRQERICWLLNPAWTMTWIRCRAPVELILPSLRMR